MEARRGKKTAGVRAKTRGRRRGEGETRRWTDGGEMGRREEIGAWIVKKGTEGVVDGWE